MARADSEQWLSQVSLSLVPSLQCNLSCRHCFVPTEARGRPMTAAELRGLLDRVGPLGFRSLELTGGEFFAWQHAAAVLPAVAASPVRTTILTNATLLEREHLAVLRDSSVRLRISLDGSEPLHDAIRGAGAYARTRRAAELCQTFSVPFALHCTVTQDSLSDVPAAIQSALELGATEISFAPLHQLAGRSPALANQRLDDEQCVDLVAQLTALRKRMPEDFEISWHSLGMRAVAVMHPCSVYACWGEFCLSPKHWPDALAVMPDGEVLPQSLHVHPRYSLGNALGKGLDAVVERYWLGPNHAEFQRLCRYIYQDLIYGSDRPLFLWDELVHQASQRPVEELPTYETVTHPHDHSAEIEQARRDGSLDETAFPLPFR